MSEITGTLIIGAGPAGLFCAEELLARGYPGDYITIVDMGRSMGDRRCPQTECCNCEGCDILEGVGGAGGFSDGKMTLSINRGTQNEPLFREADVAMLEDIDELMVHYGGEGTLSVPIEDPDKSDFFREVEGAGFKFDTYKLRHLGSDGAQKMIMAQEKNLRSDGVNFILNSRVINLLWNSCDCEATKVIGAYMDTPNEDDYVIYADQTVVATGLQGEPWLRDQAKRMGVELLGGHAGIGIRLEATADNLKPLFDTFYDFKLELDTPIGKLRSFCCNREGYIVNENHQELMIRNVNGHTNMAAELKSKSSNFAIIAKIAGNRTGIVSPQEWVKDIARGINGMADGATVAQLAHDFIIDEPSDYLIVEENPTLTNHQAVAGINLADNMPDDLSKSFRQFIVAIDEVLPNGIGMDAVVYGPEIKYYGYRFPVDNAWKSTDVESLYVVGNASGYLDSYVAAALSGMIAAEDIMKSIQE